MSRMYPAMLRLEGKRCVVIGAGRVAARKIARLLESGAQVVAVAPSFDPILDKIDPRGRIKREVRPYRRGDLVGAMLAFVADPRAIAGVVAAFVVLPAVLYLAYRWGFGVLIDATGDHRTRPWLMAAAAIVFTIGLGQRLDERVPQSPAVAEPVSWVWARQARQFAIEASGAGLSALSREFERKS